MASKPWLKDVSLKVLLPALSVYYIIALLRPSVLLDGFGVLFNGLLLEIILRKLRVSPKKQYAVLVLFTIISKKQINELFWRSHLVFYLAILLFAFGPLTFSKPDTSEILSAMNSGDTPPKVYPHWDKVFGLDLFVHSIRNIKKCNKLPEAVERHEQFGETYTTINLGEDVINTIDPENLRVIYGDSARADEVAWGVEPMRFEAMAPFCGSGFITRDGKPWAEARADIRPALSKAHMEGFEGNGFLSSLDRWVASLPENNETVDLADSISNLFLDVSGRWLFGSNLTTPDPARSTVFSSDKSQSDVTPQGFLMALHEAERWAGLRMIFGTLGRIISTIFSGWRNSIDTVNSFINKQISSATTNSSPSTPKPLVTLLAGTIPDIKTTDPALHAAKQQHVQHIIIQAFMTTQDTTSVLLSNTLFLLSRHPSVWRALRAEALSLPTPITARSIQHHSPTLTNIINESLRIYPPFPLLHRHSLRATTLPRGAGIDGKAPIFVPKGTRVTTCTYALHRREGIFGAEPTAFRPERWDEIEPGACEFMAFSFGRRSCAGKEKARLETGLVLATLARRFEGLESRDSREWMGMLGLSTRNKNGCLVAFVKRKGEEA